MADPLFMYKLRNGLLGTPDNYGGLLDQNQTNSAANNGLMNFGAALLAAGGPSREPTNLGQALGGAMLQGRQAQQQSGQQALQSLLLKTQLERGKKGDLVAIIGHDGKPKYAYASDAVGQSPYSMVSPAKDAASIQEYNLYSEQMRKANKEPIPFDQFLRLRTDQTTQTRSTVSDVAEVPTLVTTTGPKAGDTKPLSTLPKVTDAKRQTANAAASGRVEGEATTQAQIDLPSVLDKGQQTLDTIEKLRKHPGREQGTGASRMLGLQKVPGTDAYDFDVLRKQASGKVFLEAFQSLKGAGQITEVEGTKATEAIARMDAAQSEEAYMDALNDFESVVRKGMDKARIKARGVSKPSEKTEAKPRSREDILKQYGVQ